MQNKDLLILILTAAIEAGQETLKYYGKEFTVDYKSDDSPLTQADLASNKVINAYLEQTDIPVLSEENTNAEFEVRKNWEKLWIVDPLDGTKEFVKNRNEYTINIALVENNAPVLGVVYAPVLDTLYFGDVNFGAFKLEKAFSFLNNIESILEQSVKIVGNAGVDKLVVVASQSHRNAETDAIISKISELHSNVEIKSYGSSLKLCMVAEGTANIYPRIAPTMEWDTAAGHAVALAAGCKVVKFPELTPVVYNKQDLLNPWFIVYAHGTEKYFQ